MKLYIKGIGCISPQLTFDNAVFLPEVKAYDSNKLQCIDADYTGYFDPGSLRRMGRLLKFGSAAGLLALKDAGIEVPDAISTGTGTGLLEASQKFLRGVIEAEETVVSPTAFIQSTHNTVSGNIALLKKCNGPNNTFSHRGFSFESTLAEAFLIAQEGFENILVGSYDEVSDYNHLMMTRRGEIRAEPCNSLRAIANPDKGFVAGEGAAFFVLSATKDAHNYGAIVAAEMFYKPTNTQQVQERVQAFLQKHNMPLAEVDVVISGVCGDAQMDVHQTALNLNLFKAQTIVAYKHLCGEYMTSSSFAMWLAAQMMKTGTVPPAVLLNDRGRTPRNILLYNSHKLNHSLMLFTNE